MNHGLYCKKNPAGLLSPSSLACPSLSHVPCFGIVNVIMCFHLSRPICAKWKNHHLSERVLMLQKHVAKHVRQRCKLTKPNGWILALNVAGVCSFFTTSWLQGVICNLSFRCAIAGAMLADNTLALVVACFCSVMATHSYFYGSVHSDLLKSIFVSGPGGFAGMPCDSISVFFCLGCRAWPQRCYWS